MKTPQTNDSLAKAIAYIGAVEVAPGRYAFRAFGEGPWKIAEHLETWPINENSSPAYRVEMPAWWSPNQRFAWRETQSAYRGAVKDKEGGLVLIASPDFDADNVTRLRPPHWRRITASLQDGSEVPA